MLHITLLIGLFIYISDDNMFCVVLLILESADRGPGRRRLFGVSCPLLHVIISSVYFSIYWITCLHYILVPGSAAHGLGCHRLFGSSSLLFYIIISLVIWFI